MNSDANNVLAINLPYDEFTDDEFTMINLLDTIFKALERLNIKYWVTARPLEPINGLVWAMTIYLYRIYYYICLSSNSFF